jgi:hypothetical protein
VDQVLDVQALTAIADPQEAGGAAKHVQQLSALAQDQAGRHGLFEQRVIHGQELPQ